MTYENLNFRKPNMSYKDGYFYMFDDDMDMFIQKVSDGDTSFSFPLSTTMENSVDSCDCDGYFFWSLEQPASDTILIKKWNIDNYICNLDTVYALLDVNSDAFSVEHYNTVLSSGVTVGDVTLVIEPDGFTVTSGANIYLVSDSNVSTCTVVAISGSVLSLSSGVDNNFDVGDGVIYDKSLLVFNNIDNGSLDIYSLDHLSNFYGSWYGDSNNKSGQSEYTLANNVSLESGLYFVTFELYDNDTSEEITIKGDGVSHSFTAFAHSIANNSWIKDYDIVPVSSDIYSIKGVQMVNPNYNWGARNVSLYKLSDVESILYIGYWAGSSSNQSGNWEYTIASNIDLDVGEYFVKFSAYDNDFVNEMSVRFDNGSEQIDVIAKFTGNSRWVRQYGIFTVTTSGSYDIKGRQLVKATYWWGIKEVLLYKINRVVNSHPSLEYDNINACVFGNIRGITSNKVNTLAYVKDSNLKFLNLDTFILYGVASIDNVRTDSSIIPIYDLAVDDSNVYRLQKEACYYGSDYSWSSYNYVLSTTRRFVDSINVSAYPVILPANGVNVAKVSAIVNDQYGDGVVNKPVFFVDDDSVGFMTISPSYTDYFFGTGEAVSYYKAGVTPRSVTIEGTATQYD